MIKALEPFIVLETKATQLIFEIKQYDDDSTSFHQNKRFLVQRHYGNKIDISTLKPEKPIINFGGSSDCYSPEMLMLPSVGDGSNHEPFIILDTEEESYTNRFFYKGHSITKGGVDVQGPHSRNVAESLILLFEDDVQNIEVELIYSLFDDSDVITCKTRITNHGKPLNILRLTSLQLPITSNHLDVYTYDGKWQYERTRHIASLESGVFVNDSKIGSSSHKHNPFIEIYDKESGAYYGLNIIYSGNHKEMVDIDPLFSTNVFVGVSDYCFSYALGAGESFVTPEAIMVVSPSLDGVTTEMHHFILNHIIDPKYLCKTRPIIFNNWEGTGMNINEEKLLEMARIAAKVGVEQFVMDDGWFKHRVTDSYALGDWVVDTNKFPNGLGSLSKKIKALGLKFGIWVEPEMISINSDLYRAHPEYASTIPGRIPLERRHQLLIDMTNPAVVDYLYESLDKVFEEAKPDYVKWDYNRFMSDNYSSVGTPKGEFMHRFIMGTYSLIERLQKKYPEILFESCASGGGRFDLGMLYYMPQTWGSDDTNTYFRTFITCGTLAGYPQSTLGAHVSKDRNPHPTKGGSSSLEDRFNLNAIGAFGYEFDFRTFSEEELVVMQKQVEYYKNHRELLQFGEYHVMDNCFDDPDYYSHIVVSPSKDEAIVLLSELRPNLKAKKWNISHLDDDSTYVVEVRPQYNLVPSQIVKFKASGRQLRERGIDLGSLYSTTDKEKFGGVYSRLLYLKKVK